MFAGAAVCIRVISGHQKEGSYWRAREPLKNYLTRSGGFEFDLTRASPPTFFRGSLDVSVHCGAEISCLYYCGLACVLKQALVYLALMKSRLAYEAMKEAIKLSTLACGL
jgi:hypothetical protein